MMRRSFLILLALAAAARADDFRLPKGVDIVEYAGDSLASDIFSIAVDPKGRVVVAGRGYIRILVEGPDGKAASAIDFAAEPKNGAHSLLWEKDALHFVGDAGVCSLVDADGDDRADGPAKLLRAVRTGGDHAAHMLRRGPDGWLYLLAGDQAGIDDSFAQLPTSPIKNPIGGCVVRFDPGSGKSEIVAHGFRNPFGFDFDAHGRLFTFDSDNERCIGMPWYEPTRFYHIHDGAFYGWLSPGFSPRLWRIPPYAPDTMAPLAVFGRGSPTFVVAAGATAKDADLLLGDWTFGRIHRASVPVASLDKCKSGRLLDAAPGSGFAPTAAVRHPKTGDLFVATGGRGSRGAVYRIRGLPAPQPVLNRPRLATEPVDDVNALVARDSVGEPLQRLRALERVARRSKDDGLKDDVVRAAILANWESNDPVLRFQAARAASENPKLEFRRDATLRGRVADLAARILSGDGFDVARVVPLLESNDDALILAGLCLAQRRLEVPAEPGAAWEGYAGAVSADDRKTLLPAVVPLFERPTKDVNLRREIARTFAVLCRDTTEPATPLVGWLKSADDPVEAFHVLACLAHCGPAATKEETAAVADVLLTIDERCRAAKIPRESNWRARFGELTAMALKRDAKLGAAIVEHPDFGASEHANLAMAPGFPVERALTRFTKRLSADGSTPLGSGLLALLENVAGDEIAGQLRPYWGKAGYDESLIPFLARKPIPEDREKFVSGLRSLQPRTVQACIRALNILKAPGDDDEILALMTAWDQAGDKQPILVGLIVDRLQTAANIKLKGDRVAWRNILEIQFPKVAARLAQVDQVDRVQWKKRLDAVDWSKGNAERGKVFFQKTSCMACHSGTQTIGPDLAGIAGRFQRDDLFTAILQPNRDVADRYRITQVVTSEGKVHNGLILYQAFDGLIIRTGLSETVRVPGPDVESRATVARSLMPVGLLDRASDADLADLYAYISTLK